MAGMLKIIAERAGLSQSTVSQILNRKANDFSSEETRQRVFALASELGYKQNFGHKLLRGDKTRTVGVLLGMHRITLEEHIQAMIIRLLDKLELRGYGAYLVTLSDSEEKNLQTVRDLVSRGVDCFIAIGDPVGGRKLEQEILKNKKPSSVMSLLSIGTSCRIFPLPVRRSSGSFCVKADRISAFSWDIPPTASGFRG